MGIKDLWSILTPFCERKPLYELQGKTVAVDLAGWICEAQNVTDYTVQPRMYLRNLYFRTCCLLLLEVHPVFVLEGRAPTLKLDTIAARNAIQFKGCRPRKEGVKAPKDRTRFNYTLKQCEEMLGYMGVKCVKGNGEAEAMCAYLNEDGMVDGCISQDSDCFAYGARVVYRNFTISSNVASGGAVDVYDVTKVNDALDFGRNKIVALALLCGSDYSDGVHGVGRDSALKLFSHVRETEILDRLRSWRDNKSLFDEFERKISDKNVCTSCGHAGKLQTHTKIGCGLCGTTKGCDFGAFKDKRLVIKNELNVRNKAIASASFPDEDLINEFLVRKDHVRELDLHWGRPNVVGFVKFAVKFLTWEEIYAFEKFLPVLTRWQLLNYDKLAGSKGNLQPQRIKKVRNPKGVPSYEIIWTDSENLFAGLIHEKDLIEVDAEKLWSTIEPQHLVDVAYPKLVETFVQSKAKPKKRAKKKATPMETLEKMLANTSISEPEPKKLKEVNKTKKINSYFKEAVVNSCRNKTVVISSTPKKNDAEFESEADLSDIIEGIISRKQPIFLWEDVKKYACDQENVENDSFERTFDEHKISNDDDDDTFLEPFVPLIDRITSKSNKL